MVLEQCQIKASTRLIRDFPLLSTLALVLVLHKVVDLTQKTPQRIVLTWLYILVAIMSLLVISTAHLNNAWSDVAKPSHPLPPYAIRNGQIAYWMAMIQWPLLVVIGTIELGHIPLIIFATVVSLLMIKGAHKFHKDIMHACS